MNRGPGITVSGRGLRYAYGRDEAVGGVDIDVRSGEIVALMGPSGSGKSTLLHLLAGLLTPDHGQVHLSGERIDHRTERARAEARLRRMGFVFQFGDLVPELTLVENVELPLRLLGQRRSPARRLALDLMATLDIADLAGRRLNEVSGGQAQRAAVARALIHSPEVVFADEPTGSLDTLAGEQVLEALIGAARETRAAVILVTHEMSVAAFADRDVQMRDGLLRTPAAHLPEAP
ncbi:ABC transporter ATP-binding protein [Pseudactinotalea sp. HY158]|uniref:ABC transporter ATP-binding protein n=1 Tax=Pseudactinotalea sp. HY158 TaxID=2654547 RepID=UPI00129CF7B0|nr:ATP-binding cassette domain-containing protein [Pseudactinotalea sp. HY158]QGH69964.1 ATP-binding cassette domain-containing protein [Pseudactinotalea sp. HY158]